MADAQLLTPTSDADYGAIEAAVMETARGRWFLAEFARRNRTADTQVLLDAMGRLEQAVGRERAARSQERAAHDMERLRSDLTEMAKAISRTKSEVAALRPDEDQGRPLAPSEALDAIVRTTEQATSHILEAAEHVQETAWTLREGGVDIPLCDELDRRATEIYTACSFQDLTAQRTAKIVQALRYLEARIGAMIETWGSGAEADGKAPSAGPTAPDVGAIDLSQGDVDRMIMDDDLFSPPAGAGPSAAGSAKSAKSAKSAARRTMQARSDNDDDIVFAAAAPALAPVAEAVPVEPAPLGEAPSLAPTEAGPAPTPMPNPMLLPAAAPTREMTSPEEIGRDGMVAEEMDQDAAHQGVLHYDAFADLDGLDTREKLRRFT